MARIGKKTIEIPKNVFVEIQEEKIIVKGKHGMLERSFAEGIYIEIKEDKIFVLRKNDSKTVRSCHGLMRALIQNMIQGVNEKFSKTLIAEGVGYKFQLDKKILILTMGYSHPVKISVPDDITINVESPTKLSIIGIEKQKVGVLASEIREVRPPEPYKGKGIRYENEIILRKAGKTGK